MAPARDLDEPTISVREHVVEVVAAERAIYRSLARVFAVHKGAEFTGTELSRIFQTCGEEDREKIEREVGARA